MKRTSLILFIIFFPSLLLAADPCEEGMNKNLVHFEAGPFSVHYDGQKLFKHVLGPGFNIGIDNYVVFEGGRPQKDGSIMLHKWTVIEISAIAGRILNEQEFEVIKKLRSLPIEGKFIHAQSLLDLEEAAFDRLILNGVIDELIID